MISDDDDFFQDTLRLLNIFKQICDKNDIWYSLGFGTLLGAVRHDGFIPWDCDADVLIRFTDKEKFRKAFYAMECEDIVLKNYDYDIHNMQSHDMLVWADNQKVTLDIYPLIGAPSKESQQKKFSKTKYIADKIIRSKYKRVRDCFPKNRAFVLVAKGIDYLIPDKILKQIISSIETRYSVEDAQFVTTVVGYGRMEECMPKCIFDSRIEHIFEDSSFKIIENYDVYLSRMYGDYMSPIRF